MEKYGPVFGLAAIITLILFTLAAYFLYPGYDIFTQTLSKLGARPGTGILFNLGLVLAGLLFIPFYYSIHLRIMIIHKMPELARIRLFTGILGAVFLIGVGLFPDISGMETIHVIAAFLFFSLTAVATAILSYEMIKYKWLDPVIGWIGFICVLTTVIHGLISVLGQNPVSQKIAVCFYLVWAILLAFRLQYGKQVN